MTPSPDRSPPLGFDGFIEELEGAALRPAGPRCSALELSSSTNARCETRDECVLDAQLELTSALGAVGGSIAEGRIKLDSVAATACLAAQRRRVRNGPT